MFKKTQSIFTNADFLEIEKSIEEVESKTSVEIKVYVTKESLPRFLLSFIYSILFFGVSSYLTLLSQLITMAWIPFVMGTLGFVIGLTQAGYSLIPVRWINVVLRVTSHSCFSVLGISKTKMRSGILFYISELEREIIIVPDSAVQTKLSHDQAQMLSHLAAGEKGKPTAETMKACFGELTKILEPHFPRQADDINELSNDIVIS